MKIINAHWEERNTGMKVLEIVFNRKDKLKVFIDLIIEEKFDYIVAKVPGGKTELIHELENSGYRLLENQIQISVKVEEYRKRSWDAEGFRTFIQYKRRWLSDYQLARKFGMRQSVMLELERNSELEHRKNMLGLIVKKPLMETYLLHIGEDDEAMPKL